MTKQRLNELIGKAREGNLTKGEGGELCREIHELNTRLRFMNTLLSVAVLQYGTPSPANTNQIQLSLDDVAMDKVREQDYLNYHRDEKNRCQVFTYERNQ